MVAPGRLIALALAVTLAACAPRHHDGLVVDPHTGLRYGAVIERNLVVDASQFADRRLKLRLRNSSGDAVFDLHTLRGVLQDAYAAKGYTHGEGDSFGLLLDVNLLYSGQVSESVATQFGFLGATAGGIGGYYAGIDAGAATGTLAGAALGAILGSYIRDDTYIVIAEVTLAVSEDTKGSERVIQFGTHDAPASRTPGPRRLDDAASTRLAVYAGGRNTTQAEIAPEVLRRFERILADVI